MGAERCGFALHVRRLAHRAIPKAQEVVWVLSVWPLCSDASDFASEGRRIVLVRVLANFWSNRLSPHLSRLGSSCLCPRIRVSFLLLCTRAIQTQPTRINNADVKLHRREVNICSVVHHGCLKAPCSMTCTGESVTRRDWSCRMARYWYLKGCFVVAYQRYEELAVLAVVSAALGQD